MLTSSVMASTVPTILICDDEPLVVTALARAFRRAGVDSIPVTSSEDFLPAALRCKPDLVLLDLKQRGADGRTLLARMRNDPRLKEIKVVIITGIADERVQHLCIALGADGYEVKPFDDEFIRRAVKIAQDEVCHRAA